MTRDIAIDIFRAALKAADPYDSVMHHLEHALSIYHQGAYRKLYAVAFGKAAVSMMQAVVDRAGDLLTKAIVITKYEHAKAARFPGVIEVYEAGHPLPDKNGVAATRRTVELLKKADAETLVLCLISGGGSALFVSPTNGISLEDKQNVTHSLLKAGTDIVELNTVRKHLSLVKGGRLAEITYPARMISLILSDVIGDPLDVIASGPTAPDETTFADAINVLNKYHLLDAIPESALSLLLDGQRGLIADTPKHGSPAVKMVENTIIGSNAKATAAAIARAQELGYQSKLLSSTLQGEAKDVARWLARTVIQTGAENMRGNRRLCFVAGGETTVTVRGTGLGGRNTEMALAFAVEIKGMQGITMLSAGTDGTDGPTDAAGAIVDYETVSLASGLNLDPMVFLKNNDSYRFFEKAGGLIKTGPTGTNVMDIQIVLIES